MANCQFTRGYYIYIYHISIIFPFISHKSHEFPFKSHLFPIKSHLFPFKPINGIFLENPRVDLTVSPGSLPTLRDGSHGAAPHRRGRGGQRLARRGGRWKNRKVGSHGEWLIYICITYFKHKRYSATILVAHLLYRLYLI